MKITWSRLAGLFGWAILGAGCGRQEELAVVEVYADAGAVAEARQLASDRREAALAALLAEPAGVRSYDAESIALIRSAPERAREAFQRIRVDAACSPEKRLHAMLALRRLDVAVPLAELAAQAEASPQAALVLLSPGSDLLPDSGAVPEDVGNLVAALVDAPEARVRRMALRIAGMRRIAAAAERIAARLAREGDAADDSLLLAAAWLLPSAELLPRLEARLQPVKPFEGAPGLEAVVALCEATADEALRRRATKTISDYLCAQKDQRSIDGAAMSAIEVFRKVLPADEAQEALASLVRGAEWRLVRRQAMGELAELAPSVAATLSAQTGVAIETAAGQEGETVALTARDCAEHCVSSQLLTADEAAAAVKRLETVEDAIPPADGLAFLVVAGRALVFDTETGLVPNRHDLLVLEFARASVDRFRPEAVLENYVEGSRAKDNGRYTLQFVHAGKLYRIAPRDLGDWYDVGAVVSAIHRALAEAGAEERFVQVETGDQTAAFVFGRPAAVRQAAGKLGLTLAANPDAPREAGKEFEEKALKAIGG